MALYMKKYQNKVHDSKMYGKWYWKSRSLKTIGTRQIAAEITKKNTVTTPDVMAVLYSLGEILNEKLTSGYSVKLDGIGTFRTTVCSAPAEEKDAPSQQRVREGSPRALHPRDGARHGHGRRAQPHAGRHHLRQHRRLRLRPQVEAYAAGALTWAKATPA